MPSAVELDMCPRAPLLLGIDGGGTKTECRLARCAGGSAETEAEKIGTGRAGPSNPRAVGMDAACAALDEAIDSAFHEAGLERTSVGACVIGLAGAGRVEVRQAVAEWAVRRQLAEIIDIVPDFELPLGALSRTAPESGRPGEIGVALISGTGSVAFGRGPSGETARAGGWGNLLGDAGSAYAIGRDAIEAACRAEDGCSCTTSLTQSLPRHFGVASIRDVADRIYASPDPRSAIAGAARIVFAESERGDEPSRKAIESARDALAGLVRALARKLALDGGPFPLALAGSVLLNNRPFADEVVAALADRMKGAPQAEFVPDPVAGAVYMAGRLLRGQNSADGGVHRAGG